MKPGRGRTSQKSVCVLLAKPLRTGGKRRERECCVYCKSQTLRKSRSKPLQTVDFFAALINVLLAHRLVKL